MKKLTIAITLICGLSACQNKKDLSETMIKAQVDSLVDIRAKGIRERAAEDLEQRTIIEVRSRTDSIINARRIAKEEPRPQEEP